MKHVSILVPKGHFSLVNIEGTHQIFSWVNTFLEKSGRDPMFKLHLVGLAAHTTQSNGLFTVNPELLIEEVDQTDLIIIPAIHGALHLNLEQNADLVPWIVKQYKQGAEVVSLCIGSFFLAATGLLDGKKCSTHWSAAEDFRKMFPKTYLMDDKIITEAGGIYTSGGAYSFTNLLLYLIEKYAGREVAVSTAKAFMIDIEKTSQSPFMVFEGQRTHKDEAVLNAQEYIEQHYHDRISVHELSDRNSLGRRTFERRFKKATANTVLEYIHRVRIEAAKKQLESGSKTVNEVMYEVGYSDSKSFREVFKKITHMSPVEYRNKYHKKLLGVA